jgi:quercetin dioxygenase-like cupin family protein
MDMVKQNWSSVSTAQCSLEVIRSLHLPSDAYRISPHKYEPGVRFPERVSVPFVVYVLEGSCKYRLDNQDVTLTASEFATLPKGSYWFYVLGDCAVNLVKVYHLPKILKKSESNISDDQDLV